MYQINANKRITQNFIFLSDKVEFRLQRIKHAKGALYNAEGFNSQ